MPAKSAANIRKRFKIKGHEWRVRYKHNLTDPDFGPCEGLCVPAERVIYIELKLSPDLKWRRFMHELWHAIEAELHITLDDITSEIIADGLPDVMIALFDIDWRNSRVRKPKVKPPSVDVTEVSSGS